MNDALLDLFRHHLWGTKTLIDACRVLSDEQLRAPATAAYGSILETFNHFVLADARYCRMLGGEPPAWSREEQAQAGLDRLAAWTDEMTPVWEHFLESGEFHAQRALDFDDGYRTHAGVLLAQVIHHGTLHREQICAMITHLGVEPPDLQPWSYADDTRLGSFPGQ